MPVYVKPVKSNNPRFQGRNINIASYNYPDFPDLGAIIEGRLDDVKAKAELVQIPIPDDVVLCNGCNQNVSEGYLVYLGKRELWQDRPYDIYCPNCLRKYFPKAIIER